VFVQAETASLDSIQCAQSGPVASWRMYAIYGRLLDDTGGSGDLGPSMALGLTTTDAVHYTLKLRPGLQFTDGTPLDAQAVKFNIGRHQDKTLASPGLGVATSITAMTVADPITLQMTLNAPRAEFPRIFNRQLGCMASPTAVAAKGDQFGSSPVGAGPFV